MAQIYEGMYLLDNAAVREGWDTAKLLVTNILEKHGATILSARRWDERRLAYPIKGKNRATFLLTYYNIPGDAIPTMRRDFELNETVLRSLELAVDVIPETEAEFVTAEGATDFKVPTPPDDDHIDFVEEPEDEFGNRPRRDSGDGEGRTDDEGKASEGEAGKGEATEGKATEGKATEGKATEGEAGKGETPDKSSEEAVSTTEEV